MRRIILSMLVSLDGYTEAADPALHWHLWDEEMSDYMTHFLKNVDCFIYGRKAYQEMIAYWPPLTDAFAQIMNSTPKLVVSSTLNTASWNATLIKNNVVETFQQEKAKPGKDLVLFAGASTADFFISHQLIDEYRIIVNPVLLGAGKSLFKEKDHMRKLILKEAKPFKCGNVLLVYVPANN